MTHWMKARGAMRVRRSSGWRWRWRREGGEWGKGEGEGGDWRMLVYIVLSAARKVPRRVKMRPHVVK